MSAATAYNLTRLQAIPNMETLPLCRACDGSGWMEDPFQPGMFKCEICRGSGRSNVTNITAPLLLPTLPLSLEIEPAYDTEEWHAWSEAFDMAFNESREMDREMLDWAW